MLYNDAPLSQKQFNVAEAEAERVVQPDSLADDLGREAVAVVRVGWWLHATHFGRSSNQPARPTYRDNALVNLWVKHGVVQPGFYCRIAAFAGPLAGALRREVPGVQIAAERRSCGQMHAGFPLNQQIDSLTRP